MDLSLGTPATLAIAAFVLVIGRYLIERFGFLQKYAIPAPVVGGSLCGASRRGAARNRRATRVRHVDTARTHAGVFRNDRSGRRRPNADQEVAVPFCSSRLASSVCVVMENVVGVFAAKALGIDPLIGLIAGSVTMAGGARNRRRMGAALADLFRVDRGASCRPLPRQRSVSS